MLSSYSEWSRLLRLPNAGVLLATVLCAVFAALPAQAVLYPGSLTPTPDHPNDVVSGDFNGDSIIDFAVLSYGTNQISLLLGNGTATGDGTYRQGSILDISNAGTNDGSEPWSLTVGNYDANNTLDLAVTLGTTDKVAIWLGTSFGGAGTGEFFQFRVYDTGDYPVKALAGDFNDDTITDLVVANYWDDTITLFINNGDGTMAPGIVLPTGNRPIDMAQGDFNGDGVNDLVVANFLSSDISLFVGEEGGSVVFESNYFAGVTPIGIAAAVLGNTDALDDVVTTNYNANAATLLRSGGAGGVGGVFLPASSFNTGQSPRAVLLEDVNNDGFPDMVLSAEGDDRMNVLPGTSNTSFSQGSSYYAGFRPFRFNIVDTDDDGVKDIAVTPHWQHGLMVLNGKETAGSPDGTFAPTFYAAGSAPIDLMYVDLNRDGAVEQITSDLGGTVSVRAGDPNGFLLPTTQREPTGKDPRRMITGFYNTSDNLPDVALVSAATGLVSIFQADSTRVTLLAAQRLFSVGNTPVDLNQADYSDNGRIDILTANEGDGTLSLLQYVPQSDVGINSFLPQVVYAVAATVTNGNPDAIVKSDVADEGLGTSVSNTGDVNNDGFADLMVGLPGVGAGEVHVYYGGDEDVSAPSLVLTAGAAGDGFGAAVSIVGDVDGDNFDDMVVGAPGNDGAGTDAGRTYLYFGGGDTAADGTFDGGAGSRAGAAVAPAGDINGDGFADFVFGMPEWNNGTGRAVVIFGGNPPNAIPAVFLSGEAEGDNFGTAVSGAGDYNGDGSMDIVVGAPGNDVAGNAAGRAYIYNGGSGMDTTPEYVLDGPDANSSFGAAVAGVGDFSQDGSDDVVVGAPRFDVESQSDIGAVLAYFGGSTGDTIPDITRTGFAAGSQFGTAVAGTFDLRGRGLFDIVVGAPFEDVGFSGQGGGRVYVLQSGFRTGDSPLVTALADSIGERLGSSVSGGGDFNGDGFADFVGGAPFASANAIDAGKAYVYSGGVGGSPGISGMTQQDFNKDSRPDVVVVNPVENRVATVLAIPGEIWADIDSPESFSIDLDGGPYDVDSADLDGDTNEDLVVVRQNLEDLVVLRGNGDGSFTQAGTYPIGPSVVSYPLIPTRVVLADVDGDSVDDAVVLLSEWGAVSVLLGTGTATFGAPQLFVGASLATSLRVQNIDGDPLNDIAVSDGLGNLVTLFIQRGSLSGGKSAATSNPHAPRQPLAPLLAQNYPNPFNPSTTIRFDLPQTGRVLLAVYDVRGRRVAQLANQKMESGMHQVVWKGIDNRGQRVATGVYHYRLSVDGVVVGQRKMVLAK